ncbi:16205_t:CDS:2 [Funneliformis geosporum]|uniref:16105_t:CDS:1 n=1 Tax=Funneliformis geosporum TaxID=1117311 RepID=A0A9W4SV98_9GLOM|nr:16205_t:CDS:2 [Funneliformis geosporum]CAI2182609.1 16105_t:CDS:2 [Funneliformis geosporum]
MFTFIIKDENVGICVILGPNNEYIELKISTIIEILNKHRGKKLNTGIPDSFKKKYKLLSEELERQSKTSELEIRPFNPHKKMQRKRKQKENNKVEVLEGSKNGSFIKTFSGHHPKKKSRHNEGEVTCFEHIEGRTYEYSSSLVDTASKLLNKPTTDETVKYPQENNFRCDNPQEAENGSFVEFDNLHLENTRNVIMLQDLSYSVGFPQVNLTDPNVNTPENVGYEYLDFSSVNHMNNQGLEYFDFDSFP